MNAVASCGLQLYRFGETVSIPYWLDDWRPDSWYDSGPGSVDAHFYAHFTNFDGLFMVISCKDGGVGTEILRQCRVTMLIDRCLTSAEEQGQNFEEQESGSAYALLAGHQSQRANRSLEALEEA